MNRVRRVVSGNKARFKDGEMELDLCYITDRMIIMGYPADGLEGLYRNKRKDVVKWLNRRHGKNFHIYNFCPRHENAYPASDFFNQVSRYPFPDHHPPPISLIPLFVHDITQYMNADPNSESVAVIHCKAGKGRSGTMTCCYLLSLPKLPEPPKLLRNYSDDSIQKRHSTISSEPDNDRSGTNTPEGTVLKRIMTENAPDTDTHEHFAVDNLLNRFSPTETSISGEECFFELSQEGIGQIADTTNQDRMRRFFNMNSTNEVEGQGEGPVMNEAMGMADKLQFVLELHTSRRMRKPSQAKLGVSIPSQRRFCAYWSRILLGNDPRQLAKMDPNAKTPSRKYIIITHLEIDMQETMSLPAPLASKKVSVQLARYRPSLVESLEKQEIALSRMEKGDTADSGATEQKRDEYDWDDKTDMLERMTGFVQQEVLDQPEDNNDTEGKGRGSLKIRRLLYAETAEECHLVTDIEIQFRILIGEIGKHHGALPDVASLGYVWIIPSFECGDDAENGVFSFDRSNVDFYKQQSGIENIRIFWKAC